MGIRPAAIRSAIDMITAGYVIALFTFFLRREDDASMSERRRITGANWPDCSPATTMLTYMSSNSWGKSANPAESGSPRSITSSRCRSTFLKSGSSHCSSSVMIDERIDMPAPSIDAICRENGMTCVAASFPALLTLIARPAIGYSPPVTSKAASREVTPARTLRIPASFNDTMPS